MSRWKAAGIHLSLSIFIGLVVGALLFGVWYPPPFFHAAGADTLMLLLVGVDVVLGPLLTLIVFKPGKRGLKFDLTLIALVQSIALVYGMSVVLKSRPVFLVAEVDRFVLVTARDLDPVDLAKGTQPRFRTLSWTGPRLVGAKMPAAVEEANAMLFSGLAGKDIDKFPQYYIDYEAIAPEFLKRAKPLSGLEKSVPGEATLLADAARSTGVPADRIVYLPVQTRAAFLAMLIDGATGKPLRAVAVDPWKS